MAVVLLAITLGAPAAFSAETTSEQWPVGVTTVKNSPLGPRRAPAIAVRGSRLFVIGGEKIHPGGYPFRRMNDGAVFDLRTKQWKRLPDAPFKRTAVSAAQWVGRNLVVAGVTCPGGVGDEHGCTGGKTVAAVYSARSKSWRSLKVPARFQVRFGAQLAPLMSTRDEAWYLQGGINTLAVNPRTGKWRTITPALLGSVGSTCAAKRYAATLGGARPMEPGGLRLLTVDADDWGPLVDPKGFADAPVDGQPTCNEDSVVVVTADLTPWACTPEACPSKPMTGSSLTGVLRYDLAARVWSTIPAPAPGWTGSYAVGHGGVVDFIRVDFVNHSGGGPGLRLTTATGAWTPIAPGPQFVEQPNAVLWTRGLVVTQVRDELVVYRPV